MEDLLALLNSLKALIDDTGKTAMKADLLLAQAIVELVAAIDIIRKRLEKAGL